VINCYVLRRICSLLKAIASLTAVIAAELGILLLLLI
jgi:hypothetical protein